MAPLRAQVARVLAAQALAHRAVVPVRPEPLPVREPAALAVRVEHQLAVPVALAARLPSLL